MKKFLLVTLLFSTLSFASITCELYFKSQNMSQATHYTQLKQAKVYTSNKLVSASYEKYNFLKQILDAKERLASTTNLLVTWFYNQLGMSSKLEKRILDLNKSFLDVITKEKQMKQTLSFIEESIKEIEDRVQLEVMQLSGVDFIMETLNQAGLYETPFLLRHIQLAPTSSNALTADRSLTIEEIDISTNTVLYKSRILISSGDQAIFFMIFDYAQKTVLLSGLEFDSKSAFLQHSIDPAFIYPSPITLSKRHHIEANSGKKYPERFNVEAMILKKIKPNIKIEEIRLLLKVSKNNPTINRQYNTVLMKLIKHVKSNQVKRGHAAQNQNIQPDSSLDFWIYYWSLLNQGHSIQDRISETALMQISLLSDQDRAPYIQSIQEFDKMSLESQNRFVREMNSEFSTPFEVGPVIPVFESQTEKGISESAPDNDHWLNSHRTNEFIDSGGSTNRDSNSPGDSGAPDSSGSSDSGGGSSSGD